jgi:hypothetical protein
MQGSAIRNFLSKAMLRKFKEKGIPGSAIRDLYQARKQARDGYRKEQRIQHEEGNRACPTT